MSSDATPILGPTLGALEIGVLFSTLLYGTVFVQTINYFQAQFTDDHTSIKFMVAFVWVFETIHTSLLWACLYDKTVNGFGVLETLDEVNWTIGVSIPVSNLIVTLVQGFFAYRVFVLSRKRPYLAIAIPALALRLGLGIACAVTTHSATFFVYVVDFEWLVVTALVAGAVIDITNTVALSFCLKQGAASFPSTQRIIDKLMLWTLGVDRIFNQRMRDFGGDSIVDDAQ
ncbi:hypothetical protein D9758_018601 [Tetrapyrgos nigripes]|uniref:Uncharacterized protein n=1 Tax=Tetrapyrgos nigripes TaxID=182062 RepID=A0A8H5BTY1_9AGAR|nr:hypothetical protein D9758_018601 [Tetrapyrgos nigripes]